jgi:hypothetical protein
MAENYQLKPATQILFVQSLTSKTVNLATESSKRVNEAATIYSTSAMQRCMNPTDPRGDHHGLIIKSYRKDHLLLPMR